MIMDRMQLLDLLDSALSEAELTDLSRQFAVTFGAFPGRTKRDRAREFLGYVGRQGRDAGLTEALVALRPDLATAVANLFADASTPHAASLAASFDSSRSAPGRDSAVCLRTSSAN